MTNSKLARSVVVALGLAALGACHSGSSSSAPAPAGAPNTPANPSNSAARRGLPNGVTALMVAEGDSLFHVRNCKNCHGADAHGAANGPNLTTGNFMHSDGSYNGILGTITSGVPVAEIKDPAHRIAMPARGGTRPTPLTDDQLRALAAYVYSLNHQ
ncbi:MAG TPA: c-type cytochrome [Gemmatimonadaceae bacterium]|nr:c-type cytochrome [Gemmatimonadaceae bacterium]